MMAVFLLLLLRRFGTTTTVTAAGRATIFSQTVPNVCVKPQLNLAGFCSVNEGCNTRCFNENPRRYVPDFVYPVDAIECDQFEAPYCYAARCCPNCADALADLYRCLVLHASPSMHYIDPLALSCPLNCAGYYGLAPTAAPSVAPTAPAPIPIPAATTTIAPTAAATTIATEIETETHNSTTTMEEEDIWGDFLGPNTGTTGTTDTTTTTTTTGDEVEEEEEGVVEEEDEVLVVEEEDLEVVVVIEDVVAVTDTTTTTATTTEEEVEEEVDTPSTSALNSTTFADIIRNKVPYCAAYPLCKNVLVRSCCPTEEGVMLDCCSGINPTTATGEEEEEEVVGAATGVGVEDDEDEDVPAEEVVVVVVVDDAPSTFARNSTAAAELIRTTGPRCAAYPMCTALVRKCCPTNDGMMLDCCYGIPTTATDTNSTTAAMDVEAEEGIPMGGLEDIVDGMIP